MNSSEWFKRAQAVIPGGVNSPVRAFQAVGGDPLVVVKGSGSRITTVEGRELIDFCGSWGPLILGHAREEVVEAACAAARDGMTFGIHTTREVEFAERIAFQVPSMEQVRLVNSGTEAVMSAVRLARGFTGRRRIIKFAGGYHGHSDGLLVGAGSGLLTGGISSSAGVYIHPGDVLLPAYNDPAAVSDIVKACGDELAAILVEPIAGNMGLVLPQAGFLEHLRNEADRCGALLIFDEVITGFRFGPTSYGTLTGVIPDLTCLGKIIGGGLPLAAFGGRREIMQRLAPCGEVYQAGTLSGNPVAVAAGLKTLDLLIEENPYPRLAASGAALADALNEMDGVHVAQQGGVFTPFFRSAPVRNLEEAKACDTAAYASFFRGMLNRGFYLPPSQFEAAFISAAHTQQELADFVAAAREAAACTKDSALECGAAENNTV
jgi:glutamate-1-semialdehyde 2,1-aminomutase